MTDIPFPWGGILDAIMGPGGVIVLFGVVIFFLWKLFREEQAENRANFATVSLQSRAIETLTIEVRAWREVFDKSPSRRRSLPNEPDE